MRFESLEKRKPRSKTGPNHQLDGDSMSEDTGKDVSPLHVSTHNPGVNRYLQFDMNACIHTNDGTRTALTL